MVIIKRSSQMEVLDIVDLLNSNLFFGLVNVETVSKDIKEGFSLTAISLGKIVGHISAIRLKGRKHLSEILNNNRKFILSSHYMLDVDNDDILYIKSLVVHPDFQGLGIGEKLLSKFIDRLEGNKILVIGRVSPLGWQEEELFRDKGFYITKQQESFWFTQNEALKCKYCGTRCMCSAKLAILNKDIIVTP